jgi:hypothetical protein
MFVEGRQAPGKPRQRIRIILIGELYNVHFTELGQNRVQWLAFIIINA